MFLKFKSFFALLFLYNLLLIFIYWLYIQFFQVNVVLFASIYCVFFALIPIVIWFIFHRRPLLNRFEKMLILMLFILYGYSVALSLPTVIDRSLSFYILEKLNQRGGSINRDAFEKIFKNEYVPEHRLVDIRLTEQLESGSITIKSKCVSLTNKGKNLVRFSQFFRRNFLPKNRLIMGEYTDDLIDPLKRSSQQNFLDGC